MNKYICIFTISLSLLFLAGCGSAHLNSIPGNSIADMKLKMDVFHMLSIISSNCDQIVKVSDIVETRLVEPLNSKGQWTEIWVVQSCNTLKPFEIHFFSAGNGGTFFKISVL